MMWFESAGIPIVNSDTGHSPATSASIMARED